MHLDDPPTLTAARRALLHQSLAIGASVAIGGVVFGVAARDAGLSSPATIAMSLVPFSGAAQFAALAHLRDGSWTALLLVTALLNARHVLYGASLAPSFATRPVHERAAMAHVLTDEAFALSTAHVARVGRGDHRGYWIAALVAVYVPWNVGTAIGALAGGVLPDPSTLGADVVFPATMAALAVSAARATDERRVAAFACVLALAVGSLAGAPAGVITAAAAAPLLARRDARAPHTAGVAGGSDAAVPA